MAIASMEKFEEVIRRVWTFEDSRRSTEMDFSPFAALIEKEPQPVWDFWEPDARWRRENAERVAHFGGEEFGETKSPVEAPWNRERLQRELERAMDRRKEMELRVESVREEEAEAHHHELVLRTKLEKAQP